MPTVVYNATTGSNTAASGAGPSTAITGSSAAHNSATAGSTTVTLTNSPDLSGVAAGDVIWLNTASGEAKLYEIASVDDGADTVTIVETDAPSIASGSAVDYAIGGKRASPEADTGWVDYFERGGWTFQFDNGETFDITRGGTLAAGVSNTQKTTLIATDPDGTKPIFNIDIANFVPFTMGDRNTIIGIDFLYDANTTTDFFLLNGENLIFQKNIVRGAFQVERGASVLALIAGNVFEDNAYCRIRCNQEMTNIIRNVFKGCVSDGLEVYAPSPFQFSGANIKGNVFLNNGGHGAYIVLFDGDTDQRRYVLFENNTCHGNTEAGVQIDYTSGGLFGILHVLNNALTDNGTYGLAGESGIEDEVDQSLIDFNLINGNTTAARQNFAAGPNDLTTAPGYEDEANDDLTPGSGSNLIDAGISTPSAA